jgi:Chagasin family peptidase inhibitor I42
MFCTIKTKVGEKFNMTQMVPVSGGYTCLADFDPEFLDLCGEKREPGTPPIGGPARYTFTFLARKAGTTTIHLVEVRPWHGGDVSKVTSCEILIS